jgi:hypothetical protein
VAQPRDTHTSGALQRSPIARGSKTVDAWTRVVPRASAKRREDLMIVDIKVAVQTKASELL